MARVANRIILISEDDGLDERTKAELRAKFENEACRWCGGLHQRECPRIRHIIYNPSDIREIREVEFWADSEWDRSTVLWPEDLV
jgi:hypothetical protein